MAITSEDKLNIQKSLCEALLNPEFTFIILRSCRAIILQLLLMIITDPSNHSGSKLLQTVSTCSKILPQVPEAAGIILSFLQKSSSIFDCLLALDTSKSIDQVCETYIKLKKECYLF